MTAKNKSTKKKTKKPSPQELRKSHIDWFLKRDAQEFSELCTEWRKRFLNIKNKEIIGYQEWLDYFKLLPASDIEELANTDGAEILSAEGYAALKLWVDIMENPKTITKVYQAGLTEERKDKQSIVELAKSNDKLATFKALRDDIAAKLEKGTAARDQSQLSKTLLEVMDAISELERRQGPSEDTALAHIISRMGENNNKVVITTPKKRTKAKGARNTSYKSKSIKELEDDGEASWIAEA